MEKTNIVRKSVYMRLSEGKKKCKNAKIMQKYVQVCAKAFLEVGLISSTLKRRTVLKILKKYRLFCCTSLLRTSKLAHLNGKNLACFS